MVRVAFYDNATEDGHALQPHKAVCLQSTSTAPSTNRTLPCAALPVPTQWMVPGTSRPTVQSKPTRGSSGKESADQRPDTH
ncbi:hypothetical protein C8Q74DRAFT_1283783 [Fomes fomentarius]|nr:hypothetical protein C8Q74DRAFT_1283783 [Fomes fomentarius]